jgi:hypothetical protein
MITGYNSVYFFAVPFASSTGYFFALTAILSTPSAVSGQYAA